MLFFLCFFLLFSGSVNELFRFTPDRLDPAKVYDAGGLGEPQTNAEPQPTLVDCVNTHSAFKMYMVALSQSIPTVAI